MSVTEQMRERLEAALRPDRLEIVDDSARHAGHAGNPGGDGETHFNVTISSVALAGMGRVAQHRAIHAALGADLMARIHALSLRIE